MLEIVRDLTTKVAGVLSSPTPPPETDVRRLSLRAFVMELAKLDPRISAAFSAYNSLHDCPEENIRCRLRYDMQLSRCECLNLLDKLEERFDIRYAKSDYRALRRTGFHTKLLYHRSIRAARRAEVISQPA